ncbi:MAG: cryptochrome/photolyase family protein [Gemmatimonadota bacterium]|nr:MAG: cryptochrome/photolyase family protein [Gemmatimonadota bacterium]
MSIFKRQLAERRPDRSARRWLYVPYDQLSDGMGPLSREEPGELGIVLIESTWKAARRPYHKQKLALVLANQRHFALEQAARGVAVRYEVTDGPYRDALATAIAELGPLRVMEPAERELHADIEPLAASGSLEIIEHEGWLTNAQQFEASQRRGPRWRMDAFYRRVRRERGILMEDGKPVGGKFSFDAENRTPWTGEPPAPAPPHFPLDPIKTEVGALIDGRFGDHPGTLDLAALPATARDAEALWGWAKANCLHDFGPYEDAMSIRSAGLFHTRISALLNLHRLLPTRVVDEALASDAPLNSIEGFVRQVVGWREFVRHVHRATDGFRDLPAGAAPVEATPGDGGYERWSGRRWPAESTEPIGDGGAASSELGAQEPLPQAFWGRRSGFHCLDRVVSDVWATGYGHHITRLMVLANIATLLDVTPRELADWFWVAYTDAYDWVVEPNVLGMGSFALGELMTTKPYVSGAAYINRMSDFCADCPFDPKRDCPLTSLYWSFLARHEEKLADNPRLRLPLASLGRRSPESRHNDAEVFDWVRDTLAAGGELRPGEQPGG